MGTALRVYSYPEGERVRLAAYGQEPQQDATVRGYNWRDRTYTVQVDECRDGYHDVRFVPEGQIMGAVLEYHPHPAGDIYVVGCAYCEREREAGVTFFPRHVPSVRCQSGKRPHCTCDTCF